jgi:hypothetical protein
MSNQIVFFRRRVEVESSDEKMKMHIPVIYM